MSGPASDHRRIAAAIIYFAVTAAAAIVLFIAAAVIWLSDLIGSAAAAAAITGAFFALIAWIIHSLAVKQAVEDIGRRMETVYEVAASAHKTFRRAGKLLGILLGDMMK